MRARDPAIMALSADGRRQDLALLQMREPPRKRLFRVDAGIEPCLSDLDRAEQRRSRMRSREREVGELPRSTDEPVQRQRLEIVALDDLAPYRLVAWHDS